MFFVDVCEPLRYCLLDTYANSSLISTDTIIHIGISALPTANTITMANGRIVKCRGMAVEALVMFHDLNTKQASLIVDCSAASLLIIFLEV